METNKRKYKLIRFTGPCGTYTTDNLIRVFERLGWDHEKQRELKTLTKEQTPRKQGYSTQKRKEPVGQKKKMCLVLMKQLAYM